MAAKVELKAISAAVECWQVWIGQAAKLANIASDTLQAIEDKKASASDTVRRLSDFGEKNAGVFGELSSRLSKSYYDELGRLTAFFDSKGKKRATTRKAAPRKVPPRKKARSQA